MTEVSAHPITLDHNFYGSSLGRAYNQLQGAYIELAQISEGWPKELDEYLYDEKYGDLIAKDFLEILVNVLEEFQEPMQRLALDTQNLATDLNRVARGDSFVV